MLPHIDVRGTVVRDSLYLRQTFGGRTGEAGGFREFNANDPSQAVLWAAGGALPPSNRDSIPVGMSVPQPSGGRASVVCVPVGGAAPAVGAQITSGSAARFITNIYRQLGLDLP